MKILLLLPLLLGLSVPAIAHNEFNVGDAMHSDISDGFKADEKGEEGVCMGPNATIYKCNEGQ